MFKRIFMIALFGLLTSVLTLQAQKITKSYDEFSGATTWLTEATLLNFEYKNITGFALGKVTYKNGEERYAISIIIDREYRFSISRDAPLQILIDHKRYTFLLYNGAPSTVLRGSTEAARYELGPPLLAKLAHGKIIKVRIKVTSRNITFEIPKAKQAIFKKFYEECVRMEK